MLDENEYGASMKYMVAQAAGQQLATDYANGDIEFSMMVQRAPMSKTCAEFADCQKEVSKRDVRHEDEEPPAAVAETVSMLQAWEE